jgi:protein involved in polysaccharide export with SLBB domain
MRLVGYRLRGGSSLTLIALFILCASTVAAQEGETPGAREEGGQAAESLAASDRVTLAISTPTYPVTPGDTYRLTYVFASGVETPGSFSVDAGYALQLGHLGTIDAEGMALPQLREMVEEMVRKNYPNAYPQLELVTVGLFRVFVSGAVQRAGWVEAWGLTHLSSVLEGRLAESASIRAVEVSAPSGERNTYDLFAAERLGNVSEDPFVRPGDRISVPYTDRRVTIQGEVRRPGRYDLLPSENFGDLLNRLAGGATAEADLSKVEITAVGGRPSGPVAFRIFDYTEGSDTELHDQDSVFIPSVREENPVVYVSIQSGTDVSTIRHRLRDGDTLLTVMKAVLLRPNRGNERISQDTVSPESLSLARIQRQGRTLTRVNIEALVFGGDHSLDIPLEPGDTVVIP